MDPEQAWEQMTPLQRVVFEQGAQFGFQQGMSAVAEATYEVANRRTAAAPQKWHGFHAPTACGCGEKH